MSSLKSSNSKRAESSENSVGERDLEKLSEYLCHSILHTCGTEMSVDKASYGQQKWESDWMRHSNAKRYLKFLIHFCPGHKRNTQKHWAR